MKKTGGTILKLMDIKTLVAGVVPVIFGSVYSLYRYNTFNFLDMMIILIGIVLLQSSTNMINDYYDHKRGADSDERADEKALASGEASAKDVKRLIYLFLSVDVGIALYYSFTHHWSIFLVAVIAVSVMYSYSAGKRPISYTPFGELIAGSTMGFGIMTTVIFIQSSIISIETVLVALPTALYIGTILLTNNLSDWIEDQKVGRRTLPIVIGKDTAEFLWISSCFCLLVLTAVYVVLGFYPLLSLIGAVIFLPYKSILGFRTIEKIGANKGQMMGLIGKIGLRFHIAVILGIIISIAIHS